MKDRERQEDKENEDNYSKYISMLASLRAYAKQSRGNTIDLTLGSWIAAVASLLRDDACYYLELKTYFNIRFINENEGNYSKYINILASLRAYATRHGKALGVAREQSRSNTIDLTFGPWIAAVASLLRDDACYYPGLKPCF